MKKYSKYYNPKSKEKRVKVKIHRGSSTFSNSVKNEKINVSSHRVFNENAAKNRMVLITAIMLFIVSVFLVIFQIVRVENTKNNIIESNKRIEELNYINDNIDEYNIRYAFDNMFSSNSIYNTTTLTYLLSAKWHYEVTINDGEGEVVLTKLNYDDLTQFVDGKEYTVTLYESLDPVYLPEKIACKGSLYQGDTSDELQNHFYIENVSEDNQSLTTVTTHPIIDDKEYLKIDNKLTYRFIGNASVKFYYTYMLADILGFDYLKTID